MPVTFTPFGMAMLVFPANFPHEKRGTASPSGDRK